MFRLLVCLCLAIFVLSVVCSSNSVAGEQKVNNIQKAAPAKAAPVPEKGAAICVAPIVAGPAAVCLFSHSMCSDGKCMTARRALFFPHVVRLRVPK